MGGRVIVRPFILLNYNAWKIVVRQEQVTLRVWWCRTHLSRNWNMPAGGSVCSPLPTRFVRVAISAKLRLRACTTMIGN